ncbi:cell division protease FtsH [Devosia sp. UYZn731]|uniref:AAA family ATPase n=1 Tax=Devosia sp. UYZn731 TaxID=3156345 RepID=UPI003398526B
MTDAVDETVTARGTAQRVPQGFNNALATAALNRALSGKAKALASTKGLTIIRTPSEAWNVDVAKAIQGRYTKRHVETREPPRRGDPVLAELLTTIAAGLAPIVVTHDAEGSLPPAMVVAATIRIVIPQPDSETVIAAAKCVLTGQVRRHFKDLDLSALDFDTMCCCIVATETAKNAAILLKSAIAAKDPSPFEERIPLLEQVHGYGEAATWSHDLVRDLELYRRGGLAWRDIDRAALFYGPPGTGKSLFARIVAKAAGMRIVVTSIADFFANGSGHLDAIVKQQREAFARAAAQAPCVLFVDELDALPRRGGSGNNEDYWRPVINDLLMLLDSAILQKEGVVLIGATNRIEDIEPALLRPGRMDRHLLIGPPDLNELAGILRYYLEGDLPSADLRSIVTARAGATGAHVVDWVKRARRRARNEGRAIAIEDLTQVIVGEETRSPSAIRRVALHEAGHVIAASALGLQVEASTIIQTAASAGKTTLARTDSTVLLKSELESIVVMLLGGRAAEQACYGDKISTGSGGPEGSDLSLATRMVTSWHTRYGLADHLVWRSDTPSAVDFDQDLREAVDADLKRLYQIALGIMVAHYSQLAIIADTLIAKGSIDGAEIVNLIGDAIIKERPASRP